MLIERLDYRIGERFAIFIFRRILLICIGIVGLLLLSSRYIFSTDFLQQGRTYVIACRRILVYLLVLLHSMDAILDRLKILSLSIEHLVELAGPLVLRRL